MIKLNEILEKNRQTRQNELELVEAKLNQIIQEYWK